MAPVLGLNLRPAWGRVGIVIVWVFLGGVATVRIMPALEEMFIAFSAPGPNTVGEAGKVYFAHRIQRGLSGFSAGDTPPYYPSIHGALLHASVGSLGRLMDTSPSDLYRTGRWISLTLTIAALLIFGLLGRSLRIPPLPLAVGGLLWLGTYPLIQHTVSFRPDNWILALSALACLLIVRGGKGAGTVGLLVLIPVVAFHLKATGLILVGAIGLAHMAIGQWKRGVLIGLGQILLLGLSILAINALSDGSYLAGLSAVRNVESGSFFFLWSLFNGGLMIPILVLGPVLLSGWILRSEPGVPSRTLRVVLCFWLVTLAGYSLASFRAGSNTYYFLEPSSFGLLLILFAVRPNGGREIERPLRMVVSSAAVATSGLLLLPSAVHAFRVGWVPDVALERTEALAGNRTVLAARINTLEKPCYTDDPGLNVLLTRPAVIYPLLQTQMIRAGTLPPGTLDDPVRKHLFACVIFSGFSFNYGGEEAVPTTFRELVEEEYSEKNAFGRYQIFTLPGGGIADILTGRSRSGAEVPNRFK